MAKSFTGTTVGPYRIDEEVGRGGMAVVYRGHQASLNRTVAIKVLPHSLASDPEMVQRFRQEALALAGIQHENIVHIHDILEEGGTHFLVMEFLDGVQLGELIERRALPPDQVLAVGHNIAHALVAVHARGIVHRDIKSHNVMVTRGGKVKLMDFGVARVEGGVKTVAGSILGTPDYMAPEQIQGGNVTTATDIYSLGVLLYEMATGQLPFNADDPFALAMKHVTDQPSPPRQIDPGISKDLEDTILRAMSKEPAERQESASLLESELIAIGQMMGHDITLGDATPRAIPVPPGSEERKPASLRTMDFGPLAHQAQENWPRIAAAALLLLLFGVGLSMAFRGDGLPEPEIQPPWGATGSAAADRRVGLPAEVPPRQASAIDLDTVLGPSLTDSSNRESESADHTPSEASKPVPKEVPKEVVPTITSPPPETKKPMVADIEPAKSPRPKPADYRCSEYVEFDVSPEEAWIVVDGENIGEADAWDGQGGGDEWQPGPGRYTVDVVCEGFQSRRISIVLDPRADDDECDVDFSLERILSRREIRRLGGC